MKHGVAYVSFTVAIRAGDTIRGMPRVGMPIGVSRPARWMAWALEVFPPAQPSGHTSAELLRYRSGHGGRWWAAPGQRTHQTWSVRRKMGWLVSCGLEPRPAER